MEEENKKNEEALLGGGVISCVKYELVICMFYNLSD